MRHIIIRSAISVIWAVASIVQFSKHDIPMGILFGVLSLVFLFSILFNKNKQD